VQRGFRGLWVADIPADTYADDASADERANAIVARCPQRHAFTRAWKNPTRMTVVLACSGCDAVVQRVGGVVFYEAALTQPLVAWCHACLAA